MIDRRSCMMGSISGRTSLPRTDIITSKKMPTCRTGRQSLTFRRMQLLSRQNRSGSRGWIRTSDLQGMNLTSCQLLHPAGNRSCNNPLISLQTGLFAGGRKFAGADGCPHYPVGKSQRQLIGPLIDGLGRYSQCLGQFSRGTKQVDRVFPSHAANCNQTYVYMSICLR